MRVISLCASFAGFVLLWEMGWQTVFGVALVCLSVELRVIAAGASGGERP